MGTLVVRRYPTKLFAKGADHTYVECGTAKTGWSCWGGKTGGEFLRKAPGSTYRADAIAGLKEHAGITCYLINGVCHQAANRILISAGGITVDGARGYSLSVAIYGLLGRPRGFFGICKAPFESHEGVTGDLGECMGDAVTDSNPGRSFNADRLDYTDEHYMAEVHSLYGRADRDTLLSSEGQFEFQMQQFQLLVHHKFGRPPFRIDETSYANLMAAREQFEQQRRRAEEELSSTRNNMVFVEEIDKLTLQFQEDVAHVLEPQSYQTLLNLPPDERIVLSDPEIVERVYQARPDPPEATA